MWPQAKQLTSIQCMNDNDWIVLLRCFFHISQQKILNHGFYSILFIWFSLISMHFNEISVVIFVENVIGCLYCTSPTYTHTHTRLWHVTERPIDFHCLYVCVMVAWCVHQFSPEFRANPNVMIWLLFIYKTHRLLPVISHAMAWWHGYKNPKNMKNWSGQTTFWLFLKF